MKKIIFNTCIALNLLIVQGQVLAANQLNKQGINNEVKKYGLVVDEYKSHPLKITFDSLKTEFDVSLGVKSVQSNSIKKCPDLLQAGKMQEFGKIKKVNTANGVEIFEIEAPSGSNLSSVYMSYKKGYCIGMYGSAGQPADRQDRVRLAIFKTLIQLF